jgi:hypothetical protein
MAQIANVSEQGAVNEVEGDNVELSLIWEAIGNLAEEDYRKLRKWMEEEEEWDREMQEAAEGGALDFLIDEVNEAKAKELLREL